METETYRVTATFVAVCGDGRTYDVQEITRYRRIESVGERVENVELEKHYQTTSGLRVCRLNDDTYGIFDLDRLQGTNAIIARRRWRQPGHG